MTSTLALGDALDMVIDHRGKTPKKLGGDWSSDGHRVVSALNIKGSRVDDNDHHYVDSRIFRKWMTEPLRKGDVLLTSEAPLGEVAFLGQDVDWALGQRLFALRPKADLLDGRYLFYLLRGGQPREELVARATGTTVVGIRQAELVKVRVDLPPLSEQRAVAATLGVLDDKIESNRRASTLIDEALLLQFQLLLASESLDYRPLAELATITKGVSYKSTELRESRTSLVTLKSFDRNGGYKVNGLKPYVGAYKPAQVIQPGELAVAQTDLTQGAEVVGRAVRVPSDPSADVLVASLDLAIIRPIDKLPNEYLHGVLTDENFRQHCRSRTNGTTVLHLASDAIPSYEAPVASSEAQTQYTERVRPLLAHLDALERENVKLAKLRDSLLPELLSGRVRVPLETAA